MGLLFCEECGRSLSENAANATVPTKKIAGSMNDLSVKAAWGTARISEQAEVIVHIRDAPDKIVLDPDPRTTLGRMDTSSTQRPDFDLTPFGALENGVSRMHATIERSEDTLTIMDMGSANGTHLNGQKLVPNQPRILRDGDEIRLGKLVAHIYFK